MNSNLSSTRSSMGVVLVGLSVWVHHLDADFAATTLSTGVERSALCAPWGVLGQFGSRRRVWAILTGWMGRACDESRTRLATVLVTLMFLASVVVVAFIAHVDSRGASTADRRGDTPPPEQSS